MTGRVIDRETAGFLVLLIPLAIAAVILLTAWPYILGLIGLIIVWKIWQNYQWLKRCEKINPFFIQLVKENKGCLTPMDLSLKANLSGGTAKRFLERKAEEYAAQRKQLEDKGTVYYFLTASALGSIFDESEPILEEEIKPILKEEIKALASQGLISPSSATTTHAGKPSLDENTQQLVELQEKPPLSTVEEESPPVEEPQPSENSTSQEIEETTETALPSPPVEEPQPSENSTSQEIEEETETALAEESDPQPESTLNSQITSDKPKLELIQADLAKRLEINPSTVGRRKTDPDFSEWSQSKDPEGIAWKYKRKSKTFVPVEEDK